MSVISWRGHPLLSSIMFSLTSPSSTVELIFSTRTFTIMTMMIVMRKTTHVDDVFIRERLVGLIVLCVLQENLQIVSSFTRIIIFDILMETRIFIHFDRKCYFRTKLVIEGIQGCSLLHYIVIKEAQRHWIRMFSTLNPKQPVCGLDISEPPHHIIPPSQLNF